MSETQTRSRKPTAPSLRSAQPCCCSRCSSRSASRRATPTPRPPRSWARRRRRLRPPVRSRSRSAAGSSSHSTAFQTVADGKGSPFKVPSDGRLVAWSVGLGSLTNSAIEQANGNYGGEPTARISVLKPKGKGKYKLTKQSPKVKLGSKLGTTPIITLGKPLKVKKGQRDRDHLPGLDPALRQRTAERRQPVDRKS